MRLFVCLKKDTAIFIVFFDAFFFLDANKQHHKNTHIFMIFFDAVFLDANKQHQHAAPKKHMPKTFFLLDAKKQLKNKKHMTYIVAVFY